MKRIALLLVFLLVISPIPASVANEGIDFSDLSLEALIMLKTWINEEIMERTKEMNPVRVPEGMYAIGADIPAGTYTLTCVSDPYFSIGVSVYNSNGEITHTHFLKKNEQIGKLILQHGQILEISDGIVEFTLYKGLGF